MSEIYLEFPKEDGILLTKKGLMQVVHLKELVVVRPLSKSQQTSRILLNFLKRRLMKELQENHLRHKTTSSSTTDPQSSSAPADQKSNPSEDTLGSDQASLKPSGNDSQRGSESEPRTSRIPEADSPHSRISSEAAKKSSTPTTKWQMTPLLSKWTDIVLDMMTKNPETVGRKMGKLDIPMESAVLLGNHPLIHRTVLHRMIRFMRAAYQDHKNEDILVIHREQRPIPPSASDSERYILGPNDVLLLLPTTLSQSSAHLRFELGTHFCRRCRTTGTINPADKEHKCRCGRSMEILKTLGTMHSHGSMPAFSSGTDNTHEIPHIGFHMTVGNLDKQQESLVLSFCDGEVRIPLHLSDLFAIEKSDEKFAGQINRWLLERRSQKKQREEAQKKAFSAAASGQKKHTFELRKGWEAKPGASTVAQPLLFDDDTIAITRIENRHDTTGMHEADEECTQSQAKKILDDLIDRVIKGGEKWAVAARAITQVIWSLGEEEADDVYFRLAGEIKGMTAGSTDYAILAELLDHVRFVSDKKWETA